MGSSRLFAGCVLASVLLFPAFAQCETPDQAFQRGNEQLKSGDLQGAMKAYAVAVREDRENLKYSQQFMMVRRIIALRDNLEREQDAKRWLTTAQSLRSFYLGQGLYKQGLSVDEQMHARLQNAASAGQLAETQLAMRKDAEAEKVLSALPEDKETVVTQALLSVALARQDQLDEAKKIAEKTVAPADAGPRMLYSLARMHAMVGDVDKTVQSLTKCFESVLPSQLDGFKKHATKCPDFSGMASMDSFAKVLKIQSKVAESKCSSGSSCASCPMRGGCDKQQAE